MSSKALGTVSGKSDLFTGIHGEESVLMSLMEVDDGGR